MKFSRTSWTGIGFALSSAVLFGGSTPFAKALLGDISPWLMAGLLYLGAGFGLGGITVLRLLRGHQPEAFLRFSDIGWISAIVIFGGIGGPVLLMVGLSATSAATAALLLNLEGITTIAIAWVIYRENVDLRIGLGAAAILAGAILLSWQGDFSANGTGTIAIMCACLCWGIDNNLTRKLSSSDPVQIAMIKGLVAGIVNVTLSLYQGAPPPSLLVTSEAMIVGLLGYGISLVMFIYGLRYLGTARTGAYFSLAPFIGATVALIVFKEPLTIQLAVSGLLMGVGLYLHLIEHHEHEHEHEEQLHEHSHTHDEHHQHIHTSADPPGEPHTHVHRHLPIKHLHPHYPDIHHRHGHQS